MRRRVREGTSGLLRWGEEDEFCARVALKASQLSEEDGESVVGVEVEWGGMCCGRERAVYGEDGVCGAAVDGLAIADDEGVS